MRNGAILDALLTILIGLMVFLVIFDACITHKESNKNYDVEWYDGVEYVNVYLPDGTCYEGDAKVEQKDGFLKIEIVGGGRG